MKQTTLKSLLLIVIVTSAGFSQSNGGLVNKLTGKTALNLAVAKR